MYSKEEILSEEINDWIKNCEQCGKFYIYVYADPFSWELYVYYPVESNVNKNYTSFKFNVFEQKVKIYVESVEVSTDKLPSEYILIRIEALKWAPWPAYFELFIDDIQIELAESDIY